MPKAQRYRARFVERDLAAYFKNPSGEDTVNHKAHFIQHSVKTMLYTSTANISTTAGSRWYPRFAGGITGVRLNVQGAPTGALTAVLLINGVTAATATVPTTVLVGYQTFPTIIHFAENDYLQWQVTTVNGATGPMVASIEYFTEG